MDDLINSPNNWTWIDLEAEHRQFLTQYVLNRAQASKSELDGEIEADKAEAAWRRIQEYCEQRSDD